MSKKILLIYTGGTIGMKKDPDTGALYPVDLDHLSGFIPELEILDCELHAIATQEPIDSSDMHPDTWVLIAQMVRNNYDLYDGFVILHGSDTMAYTASALSFLLENLAKPVILTGSQLPIGILRSDARENLISSLELAAAQNENGTPLITEVAIYFEYKLYRGNRTFKNSSENFDAFQSPNYPWLVQMGVEMNINHPALYPPPQNGLVLHTALDNRVAVVPVFPGFNQNIIYKTVEADVRGILLRSYGVGNAPQHKAFIEAVHWCTQQGIPVINVSQCRVGKINQAKYAPGRALQNAGVISGKDITLESAIAKLMFLLGMQLSHLEVASEFGKSLRGELTD